MKKEILKYNLRFVTPAFLGNAEQQAQWRTPPFKALIRQWWRVLKAREFGYDHSLMREAEGRVFGHAWLENKTPNGNLEKWASQSQMRIRLQPWENGKMGTTEWPGGSMDNVITTRDGKGKVRSDVYLGYGAVLPPSKKDGRNNIEIRGAIGINEQAKFRLACPTEYANDFAHTLTVMQWFATLGSRGRNGWGSLALESCEGTPPVPSLTLENELLARISRPWESCLDLDWSHALGNRNGGALIWTSTPYDNWCKAMGCLANIRVEVRRIAKTFKSPKGIGGIHLLGYPAGTKWEIPEFKKGCPIRDNDEGRLATQLRFKVCSVPKGWVAVVYHLPHRFPVSLRDRLDTVQQRWIDEHEKTIWQAIHTALDGMKSRINLLQK